MEISISIEGQSGLKWDLWNHLITEVERLGFAGLFRSDHFTMDDPPSMDSLEAFASLAHLASHSQRVHFGTLVAPFSFRDPVMMARQSMQIDALSGGRMILGVGAGWHELEHKMFGYPLGDVKTRLDRLEEGLQVVFLLMHKEEPVTFVGRYYQLNNARLLPRPSRPTRLLVGGNGPKRTLPLAARYADIWNCPGGTPELFRERSMMLDHLLVSEGRQPGDVKRTLLIPVITWRNQADLSRQMDTYRSMFGDMPDEAILKWFSENMHAIIGEPDQVVEAIRGYQTAGVEELILQWFALADFASLNFMAETILPHFMT